MFTFKKRQWLPTDTNSQGSPWQTPPTFSTMIRSPTWILELFTFTVPAKKDVQDTSCVNAFQSLMLLESAHEPAKSIPHAQKQVRPPPTQPHQHCLPLFRRDSPAAETAQGTGSPSLSPGSNSPPCLRPLPYRCHISFSKWAPWDSLSLKRKQKTARKWGRKLRVRSVGQKVNS